MKIDLDHIRVSSPCNARWEDMAGDERARFCGQCRKNVFNLSAMTRTEIEVLIREHEGKFCGRLYRRSDGRLLTADCPTGQRRRRSRLAKLGGAIFAAAMFLLGVRTAVRAEEKTRSGGGKQEPKRLLGKVSVAPAIMGDIAVPHPEMGGIRALPNCPPATNRPPVMGLIAIPPRTNNAAPPTAPKK